MVMVMPAVTPATLILAVSSAGGFALSPEHVQWIVIGIIGMLIIGFFQVLTGVLNVVKYFRSDPPNHRLYATKEELQAAELRWEQRIAFLQAQSNEIKLDLDKHLVGIYDELRSLNRAVGKVEGHFDEPR